jgi:hypothetical protein
MLEELNMNSSCVNNQFKQRCIYNRKRKVPPLQARPTLAERRAVDPPPIIQVKIKDERQDPYQYILYHDYIANGDHSNYLQSPHLFVCADPNLCTATEPPAQAPVNNALAGTTVSSLHRLKDIDNAGTFP